MGIAGGGCGAIGKYSNIEVKSDDKLNQDLKRANINELDAAEWDAGPTSWQTQQAEMKGSNEVINSIFMQQFHEC